MTASAQSVLDASALLAYLGDESGADIVETALMQGAVMSAVNWAETLSKLVERGQDPDEVTHRLTTQGLLNTALYIQPLDEFLACEIAKLRLPTRSFGLSLGDRACLALALQLQLPALTSDSAWANLRLGVSIRLIR
ncbi:type II toxin-antitoxin system VapC family toxin [Phormidesmis priestleyi]|uniref:type II toxin-antitoxin system VapC family toxin n=1 Tax=Phormidesmis priestleyi TaxID=268141 RepID=UPI00083AB222|nr:type II toxin-antitoxin system VapC family toxin [Phormidesmis priestleyi]